MKLFDRFRKQRRFATEAEFVALWGQVPQIRIVPVFAEGWSDVPDAKKFLRDYINDEDVEFLVFPRDDGIAKLMSLNERDPSIGFNVPADMLGNCHPGTFLVLGWVLV